MSAAGWLHAGLLQGELSLGCRCRQPQPSSRPLGLLNALQVHAPLRQRCVSRHAASSGTTAQPAAAQLQQPGAPLQQQQQQQQYQQLSGPYDHPLQQQQEQQQQDWQQQQQQQADNYSSRGQYGQLGTRHLQQEDTLALEKPEVVTAAISRAQSIAQLQALLDRHGPHLNHIHVSAGFVTLQRLWTTSSSSSDTADNRRQHSSSNGALASSSSSQASSSPRPRAVLLQLQGLAQGLTRVDGRYCANVLYSNARIEAAGEPAAYCGPLVEQVCAAAHELVNLMPPQELATLAWSLALLEVLPAPQLLSRLVANVLRKLPGFKAQDIVMTLSGLPRLSASGSVAPYSTVHKLAAAAARQLPQASPLECALLLAVLASLQFRPGGAWLAGWWAASEGKLGGMGPAELGMTGWALGRLAPLEAQPPAAWLQAWQHALEQACIRGSNSHSSSNSSSHQQYVEAAGASSPALVELAMGVYGWSKVAPSQPPSAEFQQLLYSTTQQAMAAGSSSRTLTQRQQQQRQTQQRQQQRPGSPQQLLQQDQQSTLRSLVLQQSQQQFSLDQGAGSGVSGQLLVELLAAAARWQQLPPRAWLLGALGQLQQQLAAGSCSSRDIAGLLWALACLGVKPNQEWLHTCTAALQQQLQRHQQQQQQHVPGQSGASSLQLGDQQLQARQLAISVWALSQLGHSVSSQEFWVNFWAASQPLLSVKFTLADLAMTLEGAVQQRQRPPAAWTQAALAAGVAKAAGAAADLPPSPAAGAAAARSLVGSAAEVKLAKKQQGQQRRRMMLQQAAAAAGVAPGGVPRSAAAAVGLDLVRLATAAARLGGVPGHSWCCQLLAALRPAAHQLDQQALCRLVWCLGKLGYRPAGGALTGWLAERLAASSSSSSDGVTLVSSYSCGQLALLLSGLRGCKVVLGGRWLQQLLAHSTAQAQQMPLEVLVQLLSYVASARIRPPSSWCSAVAEALEVALPAQQQQQQQQQQRWSVTGLLAALVKLRLLPSQQLLQQLQQCAATARPQLSGEQVAAQQRLLQKLQDRLAAAEQQPSARAVEQQQQQQQQSGLLQSSNGNPQQQRIQQQQQWQAQRGSNASANSSGGGSSGGSSRASGLQSGSAGRAANAGGPRAGALWVVSSSNSNSSSSSNIAVGSGHAGAES